MYGSCIPSRSLHRDPGDRIRPLKIASRDQRLTVNLWTMTMIFMVRRVEAAAMGLAPVGSLLG
jgi:hypothetical protein